MALLEVSDIDVFYGSVQALRSVSMSVDAGERVALLGANGAGKTTTLRTISGLLSPKKGSIVFDGEEIAGLPAHVVVGKGVAHGPEGRALFPTLSVEENLRFGYLPRRKDKAGYARALERSYGYFPKLKERRKQAAGTMSGGEQQMLVVARALMSSPKLLIVDELSLGLAPKIVSQLFDIIRDVNAEGTAVVIVEQFVHMALQNTDRAYVLAKGEVVLERASSELAGSEELLRSYLGGEAEDEAAPERTATPVPAPQVESALDVKPKPKPRARSVAKSGPTRKKAATGFATAAPATTTDIAAENDGEVEA
jgi:branched-chain amino acid transport system ATP-binding protein